MFGVIYGVNDVPAGGHREMPVWGRAIAQHRSRGDSWAHIQCDSLAAYLKYIQDHPAVVARE